jgi:hypothetical protein
MAHGNDWVDYLIGFIVLVGFAYELKNLRTHELTFSVICRLSSDLCFRDGLIIQSAVFNIQ